MPPSKNGNIIWIDNLRLVALFAVIVLHSTAPLLMQYGKVSISDWWAADFLNAVVRFAVPVFVMITGALLLPREYEIGDFLKRRLTRILWPFLFWTIVYIWYSWYNEDVVFGADIWLDIRQVLHQFKYGASYHLWYIYMLIGLYFFIPVIGKFVRHASEKEIIYFLVAWIMVMLMSQPYLSRFEPAVDTHYFAGYAGYLVLGYYLSRKNFSRPGVLKWMWFLFVFSVILIALGSRLVLSYPKYPGTMFYEPVNPAIVVLSSSIFLIAKLTTIKLPAWFDGFRNLATQHSYGIYLAHALVLYFLEDPFGINYKLCSPAASIPLTAFIAFLTSLVIVWLIGKLPGGKWISG